MRTVTVFFLALLTSLMASGQVSFQKHFLKSGKTFTVNDLIIQQDGHITVTGRFDKSVLLMKFDSLGNRLWHRKHNHTTSKLHKGNHLMEKPGGGYIVTGFARFFDSVEGTDKEWALIYNLDDNGTLVWDKYYNWCSADSGGTDNGYCGRKNGGSPSDPGYPGHSTAGGMVNSYNGDLFVVGGGNYGSTQYRKLTFSGTLIRDINDKDFMSCFGCSGYLNSLIKGPKGDGYYFSMDDKLGFCYTENLVNINLCKKLSGQSGVLAKDNGYIYNAGSSTSWGAGGNDGILMKIDSNNNILWGIAVGGSSHDYFNDIAIYENDIYVAGHTKTYGTQNYSAWLTKIDTSGNVIWSKTFDDSTSAKRFNAIDIYYNGDIVLGGTYDNGDKNIFLVRTDKQGNTSCNMQTVSPATVYFTPSPGTSTPSNSDQDTIQKSSITGTGNITLSYNTKCTATSCPTSNFSFYNECENEVTNFLNLSTHSYDITSYWLYGDGISDTTSDKSKVTHSYNQDSVFDIMLYTDNQYCADTTVKTIDVKTAPTADFKVKDHCVKDSTAFIDQSSKNVNSWYWKFGNGNTSNQRFPKNPYAFPDTYSVFLRVQNTYCQDSITKPVTIFSSPTADFSTSDTLIKNEQYINFINNSTGASDFYWTFGDGGYSYQEDPAYYYNIPGNYDITLVARDSTNCTDSLIKQNHIKVTNIENNEEENTFGAKIINNISSDPYLRVTLPEQGLVQINMCNVSGQRVNLIHDRWSEGSKVIRLKKYLEEISGSTALINIKYNDQSITRKIIDIE